MSSRPEDDRNQRKSGEAPTGLNNNPACDQCRTRKIRCDRESPSCSNCRKANLPCDFTNKGKRINHTKQLVEDFSFLSGRLESIDASIAKITQRLDLESLSRPGSPAPNGGVASPNDDLNHFTRHSSPVGTIEASECAALRPGLSGRNNFYITRDSDGAETYHGPTAGRSLFQQTRLFINEILNSIKAECNRDSSGDLIKLKTLLSNNPTARTELRKCNDAFPFTATSHGFQTAHDGRLVSRPPQSFVESSLDFFLEEVNTVLPLFDEDHLRSAVKEQYNSPRNHTTDAWNLCFNNIIVLVMGIKLKTALSMNVRRPDLESDIFLPFLSNSYRAFNNLNDYTSPRVVNLQALITLALVASNHFPQGVFESLIHKACGLGREMGLERFVEASTPGSSSVVIERRRLFWSLYVLDKRRTFLTGKPCDLYLAESDLETPKFVQNEMWAKNALARIHMMSIWEEIWKTLYSSRAMRNPPQFREDQITRLRSYLKNWVTHHKSILERPEQVELGNATCMRLELRYSFHVAQILVHRCLDKPDNLQQQVNNARAALKIIKDISQGPSTISGISLLGRLFRSYPILPFYEIHKRTMQHVDEESNEDMELMRICINAINIFKDASQPEVYFNKLSQGLEWCMNVAIVLRRVQERPQGSAPMMRTTSANKNIGEPLARKITGKRDAEAADGDSPMSIDSRSQRRRMTVPDTSASNTNTSIASTQTTDTSQSGSVGPDTPTSGYFSDFNMIDPFGVDQKLSTFPMSQFTSPTNELSDLSIPPGHPGLQSLNSTPVQDQKDMFGNGFGFNFPPTPAGTMNPARASTTQASNIPASNPTSPRNNSTDLTSLISRLPPGSQQVLTSVPPSTSFTPESYSAFNTDLLDDSFTNVGHHPDIVHGAGNPATFTSHFDFNFSAPDQIGYGPLDSIMNMDGM